MTWESDRSVKNLDKFEDRHLSCLQIRARILGEWNLSLSLSMYIRVRGELGSKQGSKDRSIALAWRFYFSHTLRDNHESYERIVKGRKKAGSLEPAKQHSKLSLAVTVHPVRPLLTVP